MRKVLSNVNHTCLTSTGPTVHSTWNVRDPLYRRNTSAAHLLYTWYTSLTSGSCAHMATHSLRPQLSLLSPPSVQYSTRCAHRHVWELLGLLMARPEDVRARVLRAEPVVRDVVALRRVGRNGHAERPVRHLAQVAADRVEREPHELHWVQYLQSLV